MPESHIPPCVDPESNSYDYQKAADETWESLLSAGVFVEGEFTFASGIHATLKADAEVLYSHPRQYLTVLGHFATFPCFANADVLLYVPDGMRKFITDLGEVLEVPIAHTKRKPDAQTKYEFEFTSPKDKELALNAERPRVGEDVISTLGSVAGLRSLLRLDQDVHSLGILLRGEVEPQYRKGLTDHYLLERHIPTDAAEFKRQLTSEWT